jgi:hypothetical protein
MLHDLIASIREAAREFKRRRDLRARQRKLFDSLPF